MHHHLPYWLAATYLPGISPRKFFRWLAFFADIEKLFTASVMELQAANLSMQEIQTLKQPNWRLVEKELIWMNDRHHLIPFTDMHYPSILKETPDPPLLLYVNGNKTALLQTQIAIVGSRHATLSGIQNAEGFAQALAEAGFAITSGLAVGIDGAAHRGALLAKGITIGVAGTGLNHVYPAQHATLREEIAAQGGAIISEFSLSTPPRAMNFPRRNRIISGLSMGVLVVEAALKSGSLVTARHALEQGREVFAIPGSIHQPLARGCHFLIQQGAKLVENSSDILEELPIQRSLLSPHSSTNLEKKSVNLSVLSPENRALLLQIEYEITPLDVIILRSGLTAGELSSILLTLELNGYIQSVPGGYIRLP